MSEGFRGGGGRGFNPDEPRDAHGRWVASGAMPASRLSWRDRPLGSTTRAERAAALLRHSFLSLPDRLRARLAHSDPAMVENLSDLMRLWGRADWLDDESFHTIHLEGVTPPTGSHLRAAITKAATASNNGDMAEASRHLAAAVREIGPHRLPHLLHSAVAQALSVPDLTPAPYRPEDAATLLIADEDEQPSTTTRQNGPSFDPEGIPEIPKDRPPTVREANKRARELSEHLGHQYRGGMRSKSQAIQAFLEQTHIAEWLGEYFARMWSNLDDPKSLDELITREKNNDPPKEFGYETHHIVEVHRNSEDPSANSNTFSSTQLESDANKVRIPYYKHLKITAYYNTSNRDLGGLTPREYLRGKSWEEQYEFGLKTLRMFEVLK